MAEEGLSNLFDINISESAKVFRYRINISVVDEDGNSQPLTTGGENNKKRK